MCQFWHAVCMYIIVAGINVYLVLRIVTVLRDYFRIDVIDK